MRANHQNRNRARGYGRERAAPDPEASCSRDRLRFERPPDRLPRRRMFQEIPQSLLVLESIEQRLVSECRLV
jgi:hypothetical protein